MTDTTQSLRDQAEALLKRIEATSPDEEPFSIIHFVERLLAHYRMISVPWCIDDVQGIRPDLTTDQAWEVLTEVGRKHDAEYGISWLTLEIMADELFGRAPRTDAAKEE
jgi:hypothetical protein